MFLVPSKNHGCSFSRLQNFSKRNLQTVPNPSLDDADGHTRTTPGKIAPLFCPRRVAGSQPPVGGGRKMIDTPSMRSSGCMTRPNVRSHGKGSSAQFAALRRPAPLVSRLCLFRQLSPCRQCRSAVAPHIHSPVSVGCAPTSPSPLVHRKRVPGSQDPGRRAQPHGSMGLRNPLFELVGGWGGGDRVGKPPFSPIRNPEEGPKHHNPLLVRCSPLFPQQLAESEFRAL